MHVCAQELFKLKHYNDLDGGILEGFGRLLKFNIKIYVYPTLDTKTGAMVTAENLKVEWQMASACKDIRKEDAAVVRRC